MWEVARTFLKDVTHRIKSFLCDYGKVTLLGFLGILSITLIVEITSVVIPHPLTVSFVDVGQGDAIFVTSPSGKHLVIDGGPSAVLLEDISQALPLTKRTIDIVLATHYDADHITGLISLLQKYHVKNIVLTKNQGDTKTFSTFFDAVEEEVSQGAHLYYGERGDEIELGDGTRLTILFPTRTLPPNVDSNDASITTLLTYGEHTVLLTGDLSEKYEGKLISEFLPQNVTIFKAGHHGSKYSSGKQLLSYIKPEYVVISAGKDNTYGHPNPDALERLEKYSKEIISTIDKGTISFISDGRILEVVTEK